MLRQEGSSVKEHRPGARVPALPLPAVCSPEESYPFHVSVSRHVTWDDADVDMKLPTQGLFFIKHTEQGLTPIKYYQSDYKIE